MPVSSHPLVPWLPVTPYRFVHNDQRLSKYPRNCLFEPGEDLDRSDTLSRPGYRR